MHKQECRICTQYVDTSHLLELLDIYTDILSKIKETVGVNIIVGDGIPHSICQKCYSDLETTRQFRRRCIESNEYFGLKCKKKAIKIDIVPNVPKEEVIPESNSVEINDCNDGDHVVSDNENNQNDELNLTTEENETEEDQEYSTKCKKTAKRSRKKIVKKKDSLIYRKHREKPTNPFICDVCGNVFKRKHLFELHLRRHSNNKAYDCELCTSSFYTNSELTRHMRRHTGEKPYKCKYCQRKFSDLGTHNKHERTHTNDRPFPCNQCDKSFSYTFVLKNHMLTHTGERAFKCEVCDKSFSRKDNLTAHMKSIYHQQNILKKEVQSKIC